MEEFTEVLNHVVAFGFSMHKEIKADLLLEADNSFNLLLNEFLVFLLGDLALAELSTGLTDLLSLL